MKRKALAWPTSGAPIGMPRTFAVVGQVGASVFTELRVSAALMDGETWYPIYNTEQNVTFSEFTNGVEARRYAYNHRAVAKVRREGKTVLGEHAGFYDLFVPIHNPSGPCGVLITGPFATQRPTSSDVLSRWRSLAGTQGRPSDPEFLHYVAMTLSTATFEGDDLKLFRRLLSCFASLLEAQGEPERWAREISELRTKLSGVRFAERMWEAARTMIDERTSREWLRPLKEWDLMRLGVERTPEQVVVGLLASTHREDDPVGVILRRDQLQRACVELVRKKGGTVVGRVGDYGVFLLSDENRRGPRTRVKLETLGQQAAALARRFGLTLRLGVASPDDPRVLPDRYQSALAAAEKAMSQGLSLVRAETEPERRKNVLGELRRELARTVGEDPKLLPSRFDRYLDAVTAHCGYRLESTRAHLEAGFDQITDALGATAALDDRSLVELGRSLDRAAVEASTVSELAAAYRTAVADVELALLRPLDARQDRNMRRAIAYVREHLAEPLTLGRVAKVAGFAPAYFSRMFAKTERVTFQEYTRQLRIERAKQMLSGTTLSIERVGQLCGFRTRSLFHLAFKRSLGVTPHRFRTVPTTR